MDRGGAQAFRGRSLPLGWKVSPWSYSTCYIAHPALRESVAVIDADDICVGVLVAPPKEESFQKSGRAMADLIESQRTQRPRAWAHALGKKRGDFPSLSAGMNYNYNEAVRRLHARTPLI